VIVSAIKAESQCESQPNGSPCAAKCDGLDCGPNEAECCEETCVRGQNLEKQGCGYESVALNMTKMNPLEESESNLTRRANRNGDSCSTNNWDAPQRCICGSGRAVAQLVSYHDNHREDRRWTLTCYSRSYTTISSGTSMTNNWDSEFLWESGPNVNEYMYGMTSYHDNHREDRRFTVYYRRLASNYRFVSCSDWVRINSWDGNMNYYVSSSSRVITGLKSHHDNHREDRLWYVKSCQIKKCCSC